MAKTMEIKEDFLRSFWESIYNSNHKKRKLLQIILKNQKELENKEIDFENMSPYEFQFMTRFSKIVLFRNKLEVITNWDKKRKVRYKFDINRLKILLNERGITFQDMKNQDHRRKITILFK